MSDPVWLSFTATLVNAPKDIQALSCIEQVFEHLDLLPQQRKWVLEYMLKRGTDGDIQK